MKWSEVFIISFLEEYFNNDKLWIESVLSELDPYVWIDDFDGARYYCENDVKKSLGSIYSDLEKSYTDKGYGELSIT
tara:strand:- start:4346 stop:4576 length:231 start_codon:yes stop_codon:yes gene_type:complete